MANDLNTTLATSMTADHGHTSKLRLMSAWEQCEKHLHHLENAIRSLQPDLPATESSLHTQTDEQVRTWDQFILRFSKLQDTLGNKFYPALLDVLQEPATTLPMIDKLNRLEQLGLVGKASDWGVLRTIRNQFAHDYPMNDALKIAYLNQAVESTALLKDAMQKARALIVERQFIL